MHTLTEPLRHEQRQFSNPIETIQETAAAVDDVSVPELRDRIDAIYAFLDEQFLAHASAEERAVDPLIERVMAVPRATETMVREHVEVTRLAQKLLALRDRLVYAYFGPDELRALRETLYDLHAILEVHLSKEEAIYLPPLDARISAAEAIEMVEAIHAAEKRATALEGVGVGS